MRFFPDLVRCMPVAENSPRILIRWVEKELLNLLTGRYRSTADDTSENQLKSLNLNKNTALKTLTSDGIG